MVLPSNAVPIYTLKIPSTKKDFKFHQFLVKDEKALLIAQESENSIVIFDTIKEVIKACAKSKIDVNTLSSFDIEYIFLQLRAKSIGEFIDLYFECDEKHDENKKISVRINLEDVKVTIPENHTTKIPLFGNIGIVMKYPSIDILKQLDDSTVTNENDLLFNIILSCVDFIYDSDQIFHAKDATREELINFINNLTPQQYKEIRKFFETMPYVGIDIEYKCLVCGKEYKKQLKGLTSFF